MFKMTKGRKRDLISIEYFIPKTITDWDLICTAGDSGTIEHPDGVSPEQAFFEHSDMGILMVGRKVCGRGRLEALLSGKSWRGVHMEMWEEGVIEGTVPFICLMGIYEEHLIPIEVVEFMKKAMFKGKAAKAIDDAYKLAKEYHQMENKCESPYFF